jgi:hypothetical protein
MAWMVNDVGLVTENANLMTLCLTVHGTVHGRTSDAVEVRETEDEEDSEEQDDDEEDSEDNDGKCHFNNKDLSRR